MRIGVELGAEADLLEQTRAALSHFRAIAAQHRDRRLANVLERRQMREQVEALKHHADVTAARGDDAIALFAQHTVGGEMIADEIAVDFDGTAVNLFEMIDAAQEGRLTAAAGAEQAQHFTGLDVERNVVQYLVIAEALADARNLDERDKSLSHGGCPRVGEGLRCGGAMRLDRYLLGPPGVVPFGIVLFGVVVFGMVLFGVVLFGVVLLGVVLFGDVIVPLGAQPVDAFVPVLVLLLVDPVFEPPG